MDTWNISHFLFRSMDRNSIRSEWVKYKRNFNFIIAATEEKNRTKIRNIFLARAGPDVQEIFATIPGADVKEDASQGIDPYNVAIQKLDEYLCPKQHEVFERNQFWTLKPEQGETIEQFTFRCQSLAQKCCFGKTEEEARANSVIDKVILFAPNELKEKLLQHKAMNVEQMIQVVSSHESVKRQAREILAPGKVETRDYNASEQVNRVVPVKRECFRCGKKDHLAADPKCPARNKECYKCKKVGHFGSQCRTPGSTKRQGGNDNNGAKRYRQERVRAIGNRTEEEEEGKSSTENFIYNISDGGEMLRIKVGGVMLHVLVDSGCNKNIISEKAWEYLRRNIIERGVNLTECKEIFLPYGEKAKPLTVLGKFEASVEIEDEAIEHSQRNVFPKIKGLKVKIPIDCDVQPVCQHPRRPPIALLDKIEEKIKYLLEKDIIEPVEGGCEWVSPLVPIVKDNGDLRLCVDMRRANAAIVRERHFMPTIEDFLPRFTSAKIFSRLDIKDAFHQVELDEKCRYITTFITHMGLFRYKRLMFGIVIVPEVFQKIMVQVLAKCSSNAVNYIDDILVFGKSEREHDEALQAVLDEIRKQGILLNQEKCVFKVPVIEFLGHRISSHGIEPTEGKIEALRKFRAPSSAEEVRSFLGLITYLGRFLPNLATITAPLRELTHKGIKFEWGNSQKGAFEKLKTMVADVKLLHFLIIP
ncbi:uncharacterized protein K02A2.6-like [Anopheles merus]|uniref:uncharacterized protein K02A2.6-like n=1 Tax=Anopheles merus TaxID=30066 RepID=UPI001BE3D929|nr:uncharacterized protein K02A2.6-like [Anopheles merus]XP_041769692.1 uncharacterized protein K02A2.6-like [Anopheles merus]